MLNLGDNCIHEFYTHYFKKFIKSVLKMLVTKKKCYMTSLIYFLKLHLMTASRKIQDSCLAWSCEPCAKSSIFLHNNSTALFWSRLVLTSGVKSCIVLIRSKMSASRSRLTKRSGPRTSSVSLEEGRPCSGTPTL